MPRPLVSLVLCFLLSPSLLAEDRILHLDLRSSEHVGVIIEMRHRPLAVSSHGGSATARAVQTLRAEVERFDAEVHESWNRVFVGMSATIRRSDLAAIRKLPGVAAVHEDRRFSAMLAQSVPSTRADLVRTTWGTRGEGVVVAVIDSGIDWQHAAFGGGFGEGHRIAGGWDFVNDDADPDDDNGHGTHVAGIVAGDGAGISGVAPGATLLAYKVLDASGNGSESLFIAALERAMDPNGDGSTDDHADIINVSLGAAAGSPDDPAVKAVQNAVAAGAVVVISAGNSGGFYTIGTPGIAPAAITVGAVDRENRRAGFSSRGPAPGSLLPKPEVMAPGVAIVSAHAGGGTIAMSGTSMAAPHIAGIAALLRAIRPDLTPAEIKSAIVSTAVPLGTEVMAEGAGRVDAFAAASANLFASPAVIGFGRTSGSPQVWTSSVTVPLTNHSAVTRTLTSGAEGLVDGVSIASSPSQVTLEPGETAGVSITITVDNARVAAPFEGSLSFGGALRFTGDGDPLRIPWAFVKAARLTVQWEGPESFDVALVGERIAQRLIHNDSPVVTAFLPAAKYSVGMIATTDAGEPLVVFFEDVDAAGDPVLTASRASAEHEIRFDSVDERGMPFIPDAALTGCDQSLALDFPQGFAADLLTVSFHSPRFFVNTLRAIELIALEQCTRVDRRSAYLIDHRLPAPVVQGLDLRNDPGAFLGVPVRAEVPEGVAEPAAAFWSGMLVRSNDGDRFYAGSIPVRMEAPGPVWRGSIYLSPQADEAVSGAAGLRITARGQSDGIITPPLHRSEEGVAASRGLTPTPNEFSARRNEVVEVGGGPLMPMASLGANANFLGSFVEWRGPMRETYRFDFVDQRYQLHDSSGTLLHDGPQVCCDARTPGAYTMTGSAALAGSDQRSVLKLSFDTRRADHVPPVFTTFRFADRSGKTKRDLHAGDALVFSVEDQISDERLVAQSRPIAPSAVTVTWRRNGTTEWTSATALVDTDDQGSWDQETWDRLGHPPTGMHFRVDLADAIRAGDLIDLRIVATDDSGNSAEWIAEAAFTGRSGRRRAAGR